MNWLAEQCPQPNSWGSQMACFTAENSRDRRNRGGSSPAFEVEGYSRSPERLRGSEMGKQVTEEEAPEQGNHKAKDWEGSQWVGSLLRKR